MLNIDKKQHFKDEMRPKVGNEMMGSNVFQKKDWFKNTLRFFWQRF